MFAVKDNVQPSNELLKKIRSSVAEDLLAVDQLILNELFSDIPLIQEITEYIIASGGKRLRPLLVILSARALGYDQGNEHHELAVIIEFVHTATLLHDDVVDGSLLRRGRNTANAMWGNQASVLVGDFLYSRSFQLLTRRSNFPIMQVLANTTNAIAEGEVLQLMNRNDPEISEQAYYDVIYRKTAKLFESSAEIGAILGAKNKDQQQAMAKYGRHLGMAFQIIDDLLDYTADTKLIGKNVGDDLSEGKVTLPLIHVLNHGAKKQIRLIQSVITQEENSHENFDAILKAIHDTDAKNYCLEKAKEHVGKAILALDQIDSSHYHEALIELAQFSVERKF